MKLKTKYLLKFSINFIIFFFLLNTKSVFSQKENVPLDNDVYVFLKEMKVKKIIPSINDDNPNLSREEVRKYLEIIDSQKLSLSSTENKFLEKYKMEFYNELINEQTTTTLFGGKNNIGNKLSDFFSHKKKYIYYYEKDGTNVFFEGLGNGIYGHRLKPGTNNTEIGDIGFRIRGTVAEKIGYSFTVQKGMIKGNLKLGEIVYPALLSNYKYVEQSGDMPSYDYAFGYLKYSTSPKNKMNISVQIGREPITIGYGYNEKLVLSYHHTNIDFLKFNFQYGIVNFYSMSGSTVGEYHLDRSLNYTKYITTNRLKLYFKNLFEIGIGESIIYSDRGYDLAYLNPMLFYKFAEMSLQDRDNGTLWLDFQTDLLNNFEIQGTFFLDENILFELNDLTRYSNKTAYQLGFFWYSPLSINDLSLIFEFTRIRPYVYSHTNYKNSYSSFGQILGHSIGPNAEQIYLKLAYNLSEWVRFNFEYKHIRSGENIVDENGNIIKNYGGDFSVPFRDGIDADHLRLFDGMRINNDEFSFGIRYEPIRDVIFNIEYNYRIKNNITKSIKDDISFLSLDLILNF